MMQMTPDYAFLEIYKRGAKQSGDLFVWCCENIRPFPPLDGDWLDEVKRRLKEHDAAIELLAQAAEDVCSLHCPSTWKTGERTPHSEKCQAIRSVVAPPLT
jgi:hypothetical protein